MSNQLHSTFLKALTNLKQYTLYNPYSTLHVSLADRNRGNTNETMHAVVGFHAGSETHRLHEKCVRSE
jgi:hypothetical protein